MTESRKYNIIWNDQCLFCRKKTISFFDSKMETFLQRRRYTSLKNKSLLSIKILLIFTRSRNLKKNYNWKAPVIPARRRNIMSWHYRFVHLLPVYHNHRYIIRTVETNIGKLWRYTLSYYNIISSCQRVSFVKLFYGFDYWKMIGTNEYLSEQSPYVHTNINKSLNILFNMYTHNNIIPSYTLINIYIICIHV